MKLERGLFARLTSDAGMAALVATRVFPTVAPQDADRPYVVYDITADQEFTFHSGPSGLHSAQVSCRGYADTQPAAAALGSTMQAALSATTGWGTLSRGRVVAHEPEVSFVPDTETFQAEVVLDIEYSE